MQQRERIRIDGSEGEGGGQVLRTALALSLVTRTPFEIGSIRGGRHKPGLRRQHLVAVQAAQQIGDAVVAGAELGSSSLSFEPRAVRHGDWRFAIGSAGSTALVLQTVLWPLLVEPGRSTLVFEGGTHAPLAPTVDSLLDAFLPALARFGLGTAVTLRLLRHGFAPAGGGLVECTVDGGVRPAPIDLRTRGELRTIRARALVSRLSKDIARRELDVLQRELAIDARLGTEGLQIVDVESAGPGNALQVTVESAGAVESFQAIGERGVRAETVAQRLADEVHAYLRCPAPIGPHLADQLLIPLALAGSGTFSTTEVTEHARTNVRIIERFLPVRITFTDADGGGATVTARRLTSTS